MLLKVAGARSAEQPGMREITREKRPELRRRLACTSSFDLLARPERSVDAGAIRYGRDTYKRIKEIS